MSNATAPPYVGLFWVALAVLFGVRRPGGALLAGFATDWLGAGGVRRFGVRFREQVWPGDVLTCSGTVSAVSAESDGDRVSVELAATRQTGGIAITGSADFLIPRNAAGRDTRNQDRP